MGRSGRSYGAPRYKRGARIKFGRSGRRRRSFWRSYVVTPLLVLLGLGAAGFVAAVVVNLVTTPAPAQQALSTRGGSPPASAKTGRSGGPGTAGAGNNATKGTTAGKTSPGTASGGAESRKGAGGTSGKGAGTARKGAGATVHAPRAKNGGRPHGGTKAQTRHTPHTSVPTTSGGAVSLASVGSGVDSYRASGGPIVATLHVAWPTWVRVLSDGKLTFVKEESTGYTATYRGSRSLDVYLGYAQGSRLTVNGQEIGPFTSRGTLWVDVSAKHGG